MKKDGKMTTKILMMIMGILMMMSAGVLFSLAADFSDLPENHWAYDNIDKLVNDGVISGFPDGTFKPEENVTREQFAKVLVEALDLKAGLQGIEFEDVEYDRWSKEYIDIACNYLTSYKINGKYYFKPDSDAVREDMAVAVVKAKGLEACEPKLELLDRFSDKNAMSEDLRRYIAIAVEYGIMQGKGNGIFDPQATLTRAEMATLLYNISEKVVVDDIFSELPVFEYDMKTGTVDLGKEWKKYEISFSNNQNPGTWYKATQSKLIRGTYEDNQNKGVNYIPEDWAFIRKEGTTAYRVVYMPKIEKEEKELPDVWMGIVGQGVFEPNEKYTLKAGTDIKIKSHDDTQCIEYQINNEKIEVINGISANIIVPNDKDSIVIKLRAKNSYGYSDWKTYHINVKRVDIPVIKVTADNMTLELNKENYLKAGQKITIMAPDADYIHYGFGGSSGMLRTFSEKAEIELKENFVTCTLNVYAENIAGKTEYYEYNIVNLEEAKKPKLEVKMGDVVLKHEEVYKAKAGEKIIISAPNAEIISYIIGNGTEKIIYGEKAEITISGDVNSFSLTVVAKNSLGGVGETVYIILDKEGQKPILKVTSGTLGIQNGSTYTFDAGSVLDITATNADKIVYKLGTDNPVTVNGTKARIVIPTGYESLTIQIGALNGNVTSDPFKIYVKSANNVSKPELSVIARNQKLVNGEVYTLKAGEKISISSPNADTIKYRIGTSGGYRTVTGTKAEISMTADINEFALQILAENSAGTTDITVYLKLDKAIVKPTIKATCGTVGLVSGKTYTLEAGSVINLTATDAKEILYRINGGSTVTVKGSKASITIPKDYGKTLTIQAYASGEYSDSDLFKITVQIPAQVSLPEINVTAGNQRLVNGARYKVNAGEKIIISATPEIEYIKYKVGTNDVVTINSKSASFAVPSNYSSFSLQVLARNSAGTTGWYSYTIDVIREDIVINDVQYNASNNSATIKLNSAMTNNGTVSYNIYDANGKIIGTGSSAISKGASSCTISLNGKPIPATYQFIVTDNVDGRESAAIKKTFKPEITINMYKKLTDRKIQMESTYITGVTSRSATKVRRNGDKVNPSLLVDTIVNNKLKMEVDYQAGTEVIVRDDRGTLYVYVTANGFNLRYSYRMVHTVIGEPTGVYNIETKKSEI